ncbi:MAG: hypothetical protein Q3993_06050 [Filifactor alocis]|nr:hypothetical protein [Filifactor alocis]
MKAENSDIDVSQAYIGGYRVLVPSSVPMDRSCALMVYSERPPFQTKDSIGDPTEKTFSGRGKGP